jgi:heme exporter protein B
VTAQEPRFTAPADGAAAAGSGATPVSVGAWEAFRLVVHRELCLSFRRPEQLLQPLVFFLIVTTLFPLGLSLQLSQLKDIAPGVLWVAALLSSLLSLDSLFKSDADDGTLEQLALSGQGLTLIVLAKTFAHWLVTGLALVVVSPIVAVALGIPMGAFATMMLSLALGTLTLSWLGAIGAGLTIGLIFGAAATERAMSGTPVVGAMYFLAALCVFTCTLAPFAATAALRITLE